MGGTPHRMEMFAEYLIQQLDYKIPSGLCLRDISKASHRYLFSASIKINIHEADSPAVCCQVLHVQSWPRSEHLARDGRSLVVHPLARGHQTAVACGSGGRHFLPDRDVWRDRDRARNRRRHHGSSRRMPQKRSWNGNKEQGHFNRIDNFNKIELGIFFKQAFSFLLLHRQLLRVGPCLKLSHCRGCL